MGTGLLLRVLAAGPDADGAPGALAELIAETNSGRDGGGGGEEGGNRRRGEGRGGAEGARDLVSSGRSEMVFDGSTVVQCAVFAEPFRFGAAASTALRRFAGKPRQQLTLVRRQTDETPVLGRDDHAEAAVRIRDLTPRL